MRTAFIAAIVVSLAMDIDFNVNLAPPPGIVCRNRPIGSSATGAGTTFPGTGVGV
jgi:hypothetical protein